MGDGSQKGESDVDGLKERYEGKERRRDCAEEALCVCMCACVSACVCMVCVCVTKLQLRLLKL